MGDREAFEKFYRKKLDVDANFNRNDNLQYRSAYVQFAWVVWQAALQSGQPVAWCFTDVNGKPKELVDHPKYKSEQDMRIYTPLYTTPQPVVDADAKREAESLAMALWRKWYKDDSPNFELCDSVAGVITQINNMTTGLVKEQDPQPVVPDKERLRAIFNEYHTLSYYPTSEHYRFEHFYKALLSAGKGGE